MLRSIKSLKGLKLIAKDGTIGKVYDFYFDDDMWTVRYLVADTRAWLPGRKVLISPIVFGKQEWDMQKFSVRLSKEQIRNSPNIDEKMPVSRQKQLELHRYFAWPAYWNTGMFINATQIPLPQKKRRNREQGNKNENNDTHLRSTREVSTYQVRAEDGKIGHVEDFILNDESWLILYVVVKRESLPGRQVLVSTAWLSDIDWDRRTVSVDLTADAVKNSPEYDPNMPVNRAYEVRLYDFYGRPKYWLRKEEK